MFALLAMNCALAKLAKIGMPGPTDHVLPNVRIALWRKDAPGPNGHRGPSFVTKSRSISIKQLDRPRAHEPRENYANEWVWVKEALVKARDVTD